VNCKEAHLVKDIILTCAPWYLAHPLGYRHLEARMWERGIPVDQPQQTFDSRSRWEGSASIFGSRRCRLVRACVRGRATDQDSVAPGTRLNDLEAMVFLAPGHWHTQ
jgi:hypothetical protein